MKDLAIHSSGLSKVYQIGSPRSRTVRGSFQTLFNRKNFSEDFWALDDVSFQVKEGEALGILGNNGSGKSTLLKILSKITYPTSGSAKIMGRVASLLEVGTGFHPELTGRENIYLNGSLLGMTKSEIRSSLEEIIHFSGVEKFIDTPVKRYSSGMFVRLAFSVAAHLRTDILLIDEVLAVGDQEFQKKCLGKMSIEIEDGKTILFVSHNLSLVNELCSKSILLEDGKLIAEDQTQKVLKMYESKIHKANLTNVEYFSIVNEEHLPNGYVVEFAFLPTLFANLISLSVHNNAGIRLLFSEHLIEKERISISIPTEYLKNGVYRISMSVKDSKTRDVIHTFENLISFNITDKENKYGYYSPYRTGVLVDIINWS